MSKKLRIISATFMFFVTFGLSGCNDPNKAVLEGGEQVRLRSMQSRRFDTTDKNKTLRTAMATLQDLGFVIDEADETLGTVSATKLERYALRMTITVRPYGESQLVVRANAQYNLKAVEDPETYQKFFDAFAKAMFLTAQQIE
jgi:hypothetical protein